METHLRPVSGLLKRYQMINPSNGEPWPNEFLHNQVKPSIELDENLESTQSSPFFLLEPMLKYFHARSFEDKQIK